MGPSQEGRAEKGGLLMSTLSLTPKVLSNCTLAPKPAVPMRPIKHVKVKQTSYPSALVSQSCSLEVLAPPPRNFSGCSSQPCRYSTLLGGILRQQSFLISLHFLLFFLPLVDYFPRWLISGTPFNPTLLMGAVQSAMRMPQR